MRLWSLHPQYLDARGLVAVWREGLLARHVLEGSTRGYRHHPQLQRFRQTTRPVHTIHRYLSGIYEEALRRGYAFDASKISRRYTSASLPVTNGQLEYEAAHLLRKLQARDKAGYEKLKHISSFLPHPLFYAVDGEVEPWEII